MRLWNIMKSCLFFILFCLKPNFCIWFVFICFRTFLAAWLWPHSAVDSASAVLIGSSDLILKRFVFSHNTWLSICHNSRLPGANKTASWASGFWQNFLLNSILGEKKCKWKYSPGARPINDVSIEFKIRPKFPMLWFKMYSTDHNEILHMSRQLHCLEHFKFWSNFKFGWNIVYGTGPRAQHNRLPNDPW